MTFEKNTSYGAIHDETQVSTPDHYQTVKMTNVHSSTTTAVLSSTTPPEMIENYFDTRDAIEPQDEQAVDLFGRNTKLLQKDASLLHLSSDVATVINLIKSFVGSGILGMPFAFLHSGIILGLIGMAVLAVITIHCTILLIECKKIIVHEHPNQTIKTFGDVMAKTFGMAGSMVAEFFLGFTQLGFCIAYLIFIGENLRKIFVGTQFWYFVIICIVILLPIALFRNLKHLSIFSIVSEVCILVGMAIVIYYDVANISTLKDASQLTWFNILQFPIFFGITIYSFEGVGCALSLETGMQYPSHFRYTLIFSMVIIAFGMAVFGILGYIAFGPATQDLITLNLPNNGLTMLVKLFLCIALLFTYPIQLFPISELGDTHLRQLTTRFISNNTSQNTYKKYIKMHIENIIRVCLLLITALVAILGAQVFGLILSLVGGLGGSLLSFVFPPLCHLKLKGRQLRWYVIVKDILLILFGLVGATITTVMSVVEIVKRIAASL